MSSTGDPYRRFLTVAKVRGSLQPSTRGDPRWGHPVGVARPSLERLPAPACSPGTTGETERRAEVLGASQAHQASGARAEAPAPRAETP